MMQGQKYNPFHVQQSKQQISTPMGYSVKPKPSEPILYDPVKEASQRTGSDKYLQPTFARPGSLLKVWEGNLDFGSNIKFSVNLLSN